MSYRLSLYRGFVESFDFHIEVHIFLTSRAHVRKCDLEKHSEIADLHRCSSYKTHMSSRWRSRPTPQFTYLFLVSLPSYPENFRQIH